MNRLGSVFVLMGLTAGSAYAATPSYMYRNPYTSYGTYPGASPVVYGNNMNTRAAQRTHTHDSMYIVARAELSFLNWKNKYSMDADALTSHEIDGDDYSFEPVFGGSLATGWHLNYAWRADIEAGYIGFFKDNDYAAEFSLSVPYLMANAYYDFESGMYLGLGAGIGVPTAKISGSDFEKTGSKTQVSPMAGLMLGFTHRMNENIVMDFRYRLAGMTGLKQRATLHGGNHWLENKIDIILDNSISFGLRYEF